MTTLRGTCSWFGGPEDLGVSASEDLAFWETWDQVVADGAEHLFLAEQPPGTTGLARRLDPEQFYIACRWDYAQTPRDVLPHMTVHVFAPSSGRGFTATPADWGPNENTGRIADLSPGLMRALGIETDDEVEISFDPAVEKPEVPMTYESIVISSGHGKLVRGASGIIDEVDEARKVVERLAGYLRDRAVEVVTFHDDTSTSQNQNLETIVDFHNRHERDLDISVHFNAYEQREGPVGTEVLYVTQEALAERLSATIAEAGKLIDRGGKYRDDLYFLNNTDKPAVLLEICFVDSVADCDLYEAHFDDICECLANELGGTEDGEEPLPPVSVSRGRVDIEVSGNVVVTVNGDVVVPRGK